MIAYGFTDSDSAGTLMDVIYKKEGIPPSEMRLLTDYGGRLGEYCILGDCLDNDFDFSQPMMLYLMPGHGGC